MPDATWKHCEREIAKRFGTDREGPRGVNCPDVVSESYAIEVKHRKRLPLWLTDAIEQAQRNADAHCPDKLAVVVLHERGGRYDDCPVVVGRLKDWLEWFGE